ncbi:MAG: hypothetical protein IT377_03455 [Polyangiaceae bacterium]|nr:hypothetical protein [Polyangiaceae bacterium]
MSSRLTWAALAALALGCGSSDDTADSGGPPAPVLETVMPMAPAGLHVSWKNVTGDCDSVEGERMSVSAAWKVVFTVPGSVDNEHDGTATEKVAHSYRLRCKRGDQYSRYSNEVSGTPE